MNYNLLSVDNTQVAKTNTNTISASSLVEALEAKDQQIQQLKEEIASSLSEKKPQIVFYAGSGDECVVCDTILTELDSGNAYFIDCLLTLNNVSFSSDNRLATVPIYDAYKNFSWNDYHLNVTINTPTSKIQNITFNNNTIVIKFGGEVTSPYTGTIPVEVNITPASVPPLITD